MRLHISRSSWPEDIEEVTISLHQLSYALGTILADFEPSAETGRMEPQVQVNVKVTGGEEAQVRGQQDMKNATHVAAWWKLAGN